MRDFLFSGFKNFRYERKFYIEGLRREEAEAILKSHPAIFREIYYERDVNNIYLDSFDFQHYLDNVNGADRRLKVRIRWYGQLFGLIKSPTLELKLKHNLHVGKLLYPLKPFALGDIFSIGVIRGALEESTFPEIVRLHLAGLNAPLLNTYSRKYFLSSDSEYRVTVDTGMKAYELTPYQNNFLHTSADYNNVIIELKYNNPHDKFVDGITNYFPFRMTRSSKYVDGLARLYV